MESRRQAMGLTRFLSIDPGEEHVGVAMFSRSDGKWEAMWSNTSAPDRAVDYIWHTVAHLAVDNVIAEQWRVYPGMAEWSECRTAEVIGVVRHLCRRFNIPFETVPARVKNPARAFVRRADIPLIGDTVHAKDAELIGWYWINAGEAA